VGKGVVSTIFLWQQWKDFLERFGSEFPLVKVDVAYLLIRVHAGEAAGVAGLAALGSDLTDLVLHDGVLAVGRLERAHGSTNLGAVGKVAGVGVLSAGHDDFDVGGVPVKKF
jgi:hypothetical protein